VYLTLVIENADRDYMSNIFSRQCKVAFIL
jgi:hypothetical protein